MIPALIVPILNRPDLLQKMLASIDHPVEKLVIIDNGGVVPPDIEAIRLPHNIGVPASWNLGMKVTPRAPWWMIANFDLEFAPGDLDRLVSQVDPELPEIYYMPTPFCTAITAKALALVGYYDENFHPAYDEDIDFDRRAVLAGAARVRVEFGGTHVGSATIHSDERLRRLNNATHWQNDQYYEEKWGGGKFAEKFSMPFDRATHIGDWRLRPERLREQAWPRNPG